MVLYYSSTGNSEHVAKRLSEAFHMKLADILSIREKTLDLQNEELFFVTFNCFWGVSDVVEQFLMKTKFLHAAKITFILTCGGFLGAADKQLEDIFAKKSLPRPDIYQLVMVTNYSILHSIPDTSAQKAKLKSAEENLNRIIPGAAHTYRSNFLIRLFSPMVRKMYQKYRDTSCFRVSETCISCGICAKNCPVSAIRMKEGKPVWEKKICDNCLRCLHHCPVEAIDYGNNTVGRLRYTYKNPQ